MVKDELKVSTPTPYKFRFSREKAFSRNIGLISRAELERLKKCCVALPGLGGVGGAYAEILARQGIGRFKIADFDRFEMANLNRQFGASMETMGLSKCDVIAKRIQSIDPEADVTLFRNGISINNIDDFLNGVDVVLDCLDYFAIDTRIMLYRKAYEKNIPVVGAGPLGFGAALQVVLPGRMSFDAYYDISDDMPQAEKLLRFSVGLAPKGFHLSYMDTNAVNLREQYGPSSPIGIALCASVAGMETVKILLGWDNVRCLPNFSQYDARRQIWFQGRVKHGNKSLLNRLKLWYVRKKFSAVIQKSLQASPSVPKNNPVFSAATNDSPSMLSLLSIIEAARLSPSGENSQPWKYMWNGERLSISFDKKRGQHALDSDHRTGWLALGCAIESISLAAKKEGFAIKTQPNSEEGAAPHAFVTFERDQMPFDDDSRFLLAALSSRHTDRRPHQGGTLVEAFFNRIAGDGMEFPDSNLTFSGINKTLSAYIAEAETLNWTIKEAHRDIFRWFRFSRREVEKTNDGLPVSTFGIARWQIEAMRLCKFFPLQALLNPLIYLKQARANTEKLLASSAGVGLISVKDLRPETLIGAGRLFLRSWCRINKGGYGLHPMTVPAKFAGDAMAGLLSPAVFSLYGKVFEEGAALLRKEFNLEEGEIPVQMFRIGRSTPQPAKNRTLRLPLTDVLEIKTTNLS